MKIGVFDSGKGGQAVARRLGELLPGAKILSVDDHQHVPYGTRSAQEIIALTDAAIQPLLDAACDAIVIACNTATTVAIATLRMQYPHMKFVGIEPMIKPAASHTRTGRITVLATPATLASDRYKALKDQWAQHITVDEPSCTGWADSIEAGHAEVVPIEMTVNRAIDEGSDVIVLACTHYHWLKDRAEKTAAGRALVLEPSDAISRRLVDLLKD